MHITVNQLQKSFGDYEAARQISFDIEKGKLIGLLGPSGGGKTTILRMLAGLEEPDSGDILFNGVHVNGLPPQKREIGFVFQNYALFKHMTVFDNIAFGLTIQKQRKADIHNRVRELIELTGLSGLENRLPHQLSGGQRQRVAFARALAPQPQLLLLDEPFAAIDAKVRRELRSWLREMIDRVKITTIFVTHDQEEAVEVADEIMIIHEGRLEQKGSPIAIYQHPQTPFVAGFVGESSPLDRFTGLRGFDYPEWHDAKAIIRPEFVEIGGKNELSVPSAAELGIVKHVYFRGSNWQVEVQVGQYQLYAYRGLDQVPLFPGDQVHVCIDRLYVFDHEKTTLLVNKQKTDPLPVYI
ncbi:sulfate ABC transporter ATP-binding protein [Paenibacillus sp. N1-5-1-14]|uniref:sulfate/molybdate ABC transporter ATP-binding protein n=1 Tax=Paenibacillus radicibacter TaxID=2972488 RepID=UPI0021593A19|nr:sulfate ABC transporter ATP-binding protein [Paenibacillus radicibacter]MCR8642642.1 sulfate ABC transporter ATP-binding protein [Paenibacillus radicibacter]